MIFAASPVDHLAISLIWLPRFKGRRWSVISCVVMISITFVTMDFKCNSVRGAAENGQKKSVNC
jgi:hypothetical protein